jgi:hypothetical protein
MKKGKTLLYKSSKHTKNSKSRYRLKKQKRQRTRRYRGGGNTFNRNIPAEAVIANPTFEKEDMGLKSQTVTLY